MSTTTIEDELTQTLHEGMPLTGHHGIAAISADAEAVVLTAHWQPDRCGAGGVLHGGYLMAMADAAGALLAFLNLPAGASTTTVESKTNFFRPVTAGSVLATATSIHAGRTTIVVQTDITNDQGALVSRTSQTQAIRLAQA